MIPRSPSVSPLFLNLDMTVEWITLNTLALMQRNIIGDIHQNGNNSLGRTRSYVKSITAKLSNKTVKTMTRMLECGQESLMVPAINLLVLPAKLPVRWCCRKGFVI